MTCSTPQTSSASITSSGSGACRSCTTCVGPRPSSRSCGAAGSVERVELDVPETLDVGDRAGFYDDTGALRDVVSTHLFQVAAVIAMDLPPSDDGLPAARAVCARAAAEVLGPGDVVYGQYDGYLDVDGVEDGSTTETFAAVSLRFGSDRWAGVPFHLRHGKLHGGSTASG